MRLLLPLVALCTLSSVPLTADMLNITLSGTTLSGSGTFTTDGTCQMCLPGGGFSSLTINIGSDSRTHAFDNSDDAFGALTLYQRPTNTLAYQGTKADEPGEIAARILAANETECADVELAVASQLFCEGQLDFSRQLNDLH